MSFVIIPERAFLTSSSFLALQCCYVLRKDAPKELFEDLKNDEDHHRL